LCDVGRHVQERGVAVEEEQRICASRKLLLNKCLTEIQRLLASMFFVMPNGGVDRNKTYLLETIHIGDDLTLIWILCRYAEVEWKEFWCATGICDGEMCEDVKTGNRLLVKSKVSEGSGTAGVVFQKGAGGGCGDGGFAVLPFWEGVALLR
jgi:hypothetical protein